MSKRTAILFLTIFLFGLFLPLISQAVAGTYVACPPDLSFYKKDTDECCAGIGEGGYQGCKDRDSNKQTICYEGFVPCGLGKPVWEGENVKVVDGECVGGDRKEAGLSCQFCHFFVLIDGIMDFLLFGIVPFLAVGMIILGGIMFYFGGNKPDLLNRGKKLIIGVVIGLFLIYGAFMLTGLFLSILGVTEWTGLTSWASQGPFRIACQVY